MTKLEEILENKKLEVTELKNVHGEHIFSGNTPRPSFSKALLLPDELSIIAEVKRISPSRGVLNLNESPLEIARSYAENGANAISVLTDRKFFGGSFEFLKEIAENVSTPLLCKDFVIDLIQIDLAKLSGASAVLLITDILDDKTLLNLFEYAHSAGLEALLEAHDPQNIKRAGEIGAKIVGINNRNLFTFEEDLNHSIKNIGLIPNGAARLSLSSINSKEDALKMADAGFDGVLIGSALMKAKNRNKALQDFKGINRVRNRQIVQKVV
jgi:indole-3-glycerol phosphate synthase